jgi:GAF domain
MGDHFGGKEGRYAPAFQEFCMTTNSNLDRESFQQLLASAFAVQESRMDTQSLSAMIQMQSLIAAGELDADGAIHLIAEHTRDVADAAGVAIALLQGRQLVYQAGVGSAAPYIGRHLTATLSVSANTMSREILRVENAQTDPRIEASICRQFGAEALLMMPIYQDQRVTGVLEVLFSEAHAFQEREVRTYRMMAGLVGEALARAAQKKQEEAQPSRLWATRPMGDQNVPQVQNLAADDDPASVTESKQSIHRIWELALAMAGKFPTFWRLQGLKAGVPARTSERLKRVPLRKPQWAAVTGAIIALVIISWSAYGDRRGAATGSPARQTSNAPSQVLNPQLDSPSVKPAAAKSVSQPHTIPAATQSPKPSRSAFRRTRVGENEIDYIADDVTMRYFTQRPRTGYNQVELGRDVTVRYFASNPAGLAAQPVSDVAQPVNHTLSESDKSISPKLVR